MKGAGRGRSRVEVLKTGNMGDGIWKVGIKIKNL
jgi:hypothetical protein